MASQTNVLSTHKANVLTNGRTFQVSLSSTAASTAFDGSDNISDIGVDGTLAVTNGGTGIETSNYKNAIIAGNTTAATSPFSTIRTGSGALYSTTADGAATFGTLPVPQGGTGITTASYKNAIITGNSTTANSPFTTVRTGSGAFYSTTADGAATFGTLPVPQGGTGFTTTSYKNAIVAGNSTTANSTLSTIRTRSGALFSTTQDGAASFGTLPVPQGGTGQTSFTKNCAILSGSTTTAALTTRAITNNTSATAVSASTNLITANTLYYHKGNSNIVTVGTISSGTWQGTTVGVGYGGTGKTSWTKGGIVYASATNTLTQIADGTADKVLKCGGSATYSWLAYTSSNTASTLVLRDSSGGFSAGAITFAGGTTSGNLTYKSSSIDASKANNNVSSTQYPTTFNITDSADRIMTRLEAIVQTDGVIKGYWYVRNYNTSGTQVAQKGISIAMAKDGTLTYGVSDDDKFRSAINVLRYINSTDVTTWTADTLAATDSLAFMRGNVTGAQRTGHWVFLNVKTIGTPFQLAVHDSSELYIWKRYVTSGTTYSDWVKMNAGYADSCGNADTVDNEHSSAFLHLSGGTMTGVLTLKGEQYSGNYAMNANNSDIIKLNALKWADNSETYGEGLMFYRDGSAWDCMAASGGTFYFRSGTDGTPALSVANSNATIACGNIKIQTLSNNSSATAVMTFSSNNSANGLTYTNTSQLSIGGSSGSCTGNAASATYLKDRKNGTASYLNYGDSGLAASAITWLCCWNGYEVRAISKAEMANAVKGAASGSWGISVTGNAATASLLYYTHTNEINFKGGRQARCWFNYRNADDDSTGTAQQVDYYFANYATTVNGLIHAGKVYNAVWNDFAEFRESEITEPGRVLVSNGKGQMILCQQRLVAGAKIISDTFGCSVGESDIAKTPLGVAGRVLAYTYQNRNIYKPGDAVCSAPNGTVDIMTREEIKEYPDRIIGIVDEVPVYKYWEQYQTSNKEGEKPITTKLADIEVKGRIWIYVK